MLDRAGAEAFCAAHPEFEATAFDLDMLRAWLTEKGAAFTRRNIEIAFRELREKGLLEVETRASTQGPRKIETRAVQGGSAVLPPSDEEQALLEKVKDDPNLADHGRKRRDELLRRAAVAQRPHFRGGEPRIVV